MLKLSQSTTWIITVIIYMAGGALLIETPLQIQPVFASLLAFTVALYISAAYVYAAGVSNKKQHVSFLWAIISLCLNLCILSAITEVFGLHYGIGMVSFLLIALMIAFLFFNGVVFFCPRSLPFDLRAGFSLLINRPLYWLPVSLCFCVLVIVTHRYYFSMPLFDYWDVVRFFAASRQGAYQFTEMFAIHGGHWHATGYIVSLSLADLTQMDHRVEITINLILAAIGFVGLMRIIERLAKNLGAFEAAPGIIPWAIGIIGFCYFSLDQVENFFTAWQIAVFANVAASLWCIEAFSRGALTYRRLAVAALCAALAIYGFGGGWALLPLGFLLIAAGGGLETAKGRRCMMLWAGLTAFFILHFILAYKAAPVRQSGVVFLKIDSLSNVVALTQYLVNYIMTPVTRFSKEFTLPALILCLGGLFQAFRILRSDKSLSGKKFIAAIAPIIAVGLYPLGAGFLSALGRLEDFGPDQARIFRYLTQGNYFWYMVFAIGLCAAAKAAGQARYMMIVFVGFFCLAKFASIINVAPQTIADAKAFRMVARDLAACPESEITPQMQSQFAASWQDVDDLHAFIRRESLSLYKKPSPERIDECR